MSAARAYSWKPAPTPGGTDDYHAAFLDPLVAETAVCTYDRPGTGTSDPLPHRRRTMRDLCVVQDQVVATLPLRDGPYVLVGRSGGGNLNVGCAARHPERVAGLVTIDSYHDDPKPCERKGPGGRTTRSSWTTSTTPSSWTL